jgi:hypothetical protein
MEKTFSIYSPGDVRPARIKDSLLEFVENFEVGDFSRFIRENLDAYVEIFLSSNKKKSSIRIGDDVRFKLETLQRHHYMRDFNIPQSYLPYLIHLYISSKYDNNVI